MGKIVTELTIRTSEKGWLARLAAAYKKKQPIVLIDDAEVGVNPKEQTILQMGRQAGHSAGDWIGVLVALGMTVFGAWMVIAAILDPDPTSKLGLLIGSGGKRGSAHRRRRIHCDTYNYQVQAAVNQGYKGGI